MLSESLRILDFDSSLTRQEKLIQLFQPKIFDLRKTASFCRHWMSQKTADEVAKFLTPELKNAITFLGSGDFHHVSSLLISQFKEPLSVIIFDHHPDWDTLPPRFGCGSWVNRILKKENVIKVVLLGVSSGDISGLGIHSANLEALKNERLEIYAYEHKPTRVYLRNVPENSSIKIKKGLFFADIYWRELKNHINGLWKEIIARLPTQKVYVSIDKDCLTSNNSLTNWEEGFLNLNDLLTMLEEIKEKFDILGADITGDYSQPVVSNIIKKAILKIDHPKDYTAKGKSGKQIDSVNENTNIRIIEALKD